MTANSTPPVVLTIAGSDSSGGAGLQADLRTLAALGVHGATAITTVTAQNTRGLVDVRHLDPDFVVAQIDVVVADMSVVAVKTGMLGSAAMIHAVASVADDARLPQLVVDPVLVSAAGKPLFPADAVAAYRDQLFPHALVVTPNLAEAGLLVGRQITSIAEQTEAAHQIAATGAAWVVVKGGGPSRTQSRGPAVDVVVQSASGQATELRADWVDTENVHGSGCSLASAIAAHLARGDQPEEAIGAAKRFVARAIAGSASWRLGAGHGPLDHLGWSDASGS